MIRYSDNDPSVGSTTNQYWNLRVDWLPPVVVFGFVLLIWEVGCRVFEVPEYLAPTPTRVAFEIRDRFGTLARDTAITAIEAFAGFTLANFFSFVVALGLSHSRVLERSLYPYMIALKSLPIIAIAPLLILWFGYGMMGKIVMAAIISFFPLVVNATTGLKSAQQDAVDLMRSFSASEIQILLKLRIPTAVPHIFSALKISSTLSVVGAIVGEMTGAREGIGASILISSYNVDTPLLFASIFAASCTGLGFFAAVTLLEFLTMRRMGGANGSDRDE